MCCKEGYCRRHVQRKKSFSLTPRGVQSGVQFYRHTVNHVFVNSVVGVVYGIALAEFIEDAKIIVALSL